MYRELLCEVQSLPTQCDIYLALIPKAFFTQAFHRNVDYL